MMKRNTFSDHHRGRRAPMRLASLVAAVAILGAAACAPPAPETPAPEPAPETDAAVEERTEAAIGGSTTDPRYGLEAGVLDAEQAIWNLRLLSATPTPEGFIGVTNSDLAFRGDYAIQGNYNGFLIWDISEPAEPALVESYLCPASQSDVSVYENLLFVSAEGRDSRLDCGTQGVDERVSDERILGIRIFDISDLENPEYIANVQTCRGSHTHSLLVDPDDPENVYVYVSGSAPVRPAEELPGCSGAMPEEDPNSALFRIEVIRVPLDNPEAAEIVSSPRIFENLPAPPEHGLSPADRAEIEEARERGAFIAEIDGQPVIVPDQAVEQLLAQIVQARGGTGEPTAADSATLRQRLPAIAARISENQEETGPTQCHDITLYPAMDVAGGACEGYGLLLDISDPVHPVRIDAVADSNFAYWHSATFDNEATKLVFTDEWGGGRGAKCRPSDPMEWGANAIFTIEDRELEFESYYKLPAAQSEVENCVAHNGSMIPIPGRDVMVQAWYQGGVSIFDFTDPENPFEIAYFDRGPVNAEQVELGGSWSAYWYNGAIYSSEIGRGLDVLELAPSEYLTQNEIAAANTVEMAYLNPQGQPHYTFPATFVLARAYVDQLERSDALSGDRIEEIRETLDEADDASGTTRADALTALASELEAEDTAAAEKVRMLVDVLRELARS